MELEFIEEHPSFNFKEHEEYRSKAETLCAEEGFTKNFYLNVVFMTDEDLLQINKQYLNHDFYTDIITFPIEESEDDLEAEIYISVDRVEENARKYKTSVDVELLRVFLHGILHLLGYGDKTAEEKKVMRAKELYYINS